MRQAESDLARYQTLGREDSIALQQVADQQFLVAQYAAAMETDQGLINSDQTQLDYTTLRAPFDGVTGLLQIQIGNLIQPTNTTGIVVLTQVQPISVVFISAERRYRRRSRRPWRGDRFKRRSMIKAARNSSMSARCCRSTTRRPRLPEPFSSRRYFRTSIVSSGPGRSSMSTSRPRSSHNALTVPTNALQQNNKGQFVYVVGADNRVVGPAGRSCAAAACGRADLEGAASWRDRRRAGSVPADARDARRRDGASQCA